LSVPETPETAKKSEESPEIIADDDSGISNDSKDSEPQVLVQTSKPSPPPAQELSHVDPTPEPKAEKAPAVEPVTDSPTSKTPPSQLEDVSQVAEKQKASNKSMCCIS